MLRKWSQITMPAPKIIPIRIQMQTIESKTNKKEFPIAQNVGPAYLHDGERFLIEMRVAE